MNSVLSGLSLSLFVESHLLTSSYQQKLSQRQTYPEKFGKIHSAAWLVEASEMKKSDKF